MDPLSGIPLGPDYSQPAPGTIPETTPPPPVAPGAVSLQLQPGATSVWLVSKDGKPGKFAISDLPTLVGAGYTQMDPAAAHKLDLEEKHESAIEGLKAFGQGAVETLAPVVGPLAMAAAGRSMETQRESAEMHPIAHPVGQVLGAVAPAIATFGGSTPASAAAGVTGAARTGLGVAARASAPEMINLAGRAAATGVEGIAGKSALSRITASAVNQATQGAAYAGADWANRVVQGDPKATAEQLFSQGVGAALFGGGLGALGGTMTKMASGHTADFVETLRDLEARGGLKATGAIQGLLSKWEKQVGPERLKEIGKFLGREGGVGPFKSFEEMLQLAEDRFKAPAVQKMEEVLASVTGKKHGYGFIDEIIDEIRKDPLIVKWSRNALDKEGYGKFESVMNDLEHQFALHDANGMITAYTAISPKSLHELSQAFREKARGYASSLEAGRSAMTNAFDAGRFITDRRLDKMLDDVTKNLGGNPGELVKAWKDAKFRYQAGLFLEEGATKGWNRGLGNNQISPMEAMGAMTGAVTGHAPGAALLGTAVGIVRREGSALENSGARHVADFLEKMQQRSGQKIGEGIEKIFRGAAGKLSADLGETWSEHRLTRSNFAEKTAMLNRMAQDPEHVAQKITGSFGPLVEGHGGVAMALHDTASKVAQNLSGALPSYQKTGPLDADYTPSPSELAVFNRQWLIAHEPTSILNRIAEGSYLEEDGKGLRAMYPSLEPKIKAAVADALAEKLASGEVIPNRAKLGLSQFLGMDLDRRTTGGAIAAAQAVYLAQAQAQQQQKPPPKVDFKSSGQGMTDRQATEARMQKA